MNEKLLQPDWAGDLSPEEMAIVKKELKANRRARAKWGFGRGTGRLNDERIRQAAMFGVDGLQNTSSEALSGLIQIRAKNGRGLR